MAEPRLDYQKLQHSANPGFIMEAPSLERLYINAALALTDLLVDLETIKETERITVTVEASELEALMAEWLGEVLSHFKDGQFLCRRIVFDSFDGKRIRATLHGEKYDPIRHGHVTDIKGVSRSFEFGERMEPHPNFFVKVFLEYR